jgi:hypothetical protein
LAEQVAGHSSAAETFLHKLASLVRLALSAAVQKRDFLRRHSQQRPAITRGFLLDRARLVVAPVGLYRAVRALLGQDPGKGGAALGLARRIILELDDVLRREGASRRLATLLDGYLLAADGFGSQGRWQASMEGPPADGKSQLRTAGALQAAADLGTVAVLLPPEELETAEEVAGWLRWAWRHTDVIRVRLVRSAAQALQLTVPWPE